MERRAADQKLIKAVAPGRPLQNDRYVLRVMEQFEKAINNLSNLDFLKENMFPKIQEDNNALGVTANMAEKVQKAFIMTLEMGLKQKLTAQAKLGWESFYQ